MKYNPLIEAGTVSDEVVHGVDLMPTLAELMDFDMDRTSWEYGSKNINYLVVSIAWQGVSIPIAWTCLDKNGGNSSTAERIELVQRVLKLIPASKIDGLLAYREFIGQGWFQWLKDHHLLCRLHIRSNLSVMGRHGQEIPAGKLFRSVKLNQNVVWHTKRKVSGVPLYLGARRTLKGLLIVVATEKPNTMIEFTISAGVLRLFLAALRVEALIWSLLT